MKFSSVMTVFRQCVPCGLMPLSALGLLTCLAITGCNKPEEGGAIQGVSQNAELVNSAPAATTNKKTKTTIAPADANVAVDDNKPVSYDIQNWDVAIPEASKLDNLDLATLNTAELKALQKVLGTVKVTDESSLDYASNAAIRYRFMQGEEPYLDLIDSKSYLEFGWYYANPSDSESEKKMSIEHAKKVYTVAKALMGEAGTALVANMLTGQIIKNKKVGGQQVELAKCEFYSCMLIIQKPR